MGKTVEGRRGKKKKGRPSLLDLQKRTLKQHHHQPHPQRNPNNSTPLSSHIYNSATPTPPRRSTRRNPSPAPSSPETSQPGLDDEAGLDGNRREKQLNLVLKRPPSQKLKPSSSSLNSNGAEFDEEDDRNRVSIHKKRKINAIDDGSGFRYNNKGEKSIPGTNPPDYAQDSGPSTPLPDKKLLLFIVDRLQKKDTYGAFSEPVDPEELPDYHEVIDHPMDFATIRKKLSSGAYTNLEQFERDAFLICSNAMLYNAPDTIYFRQARAIRELAKKDFENLRQDSDDNETEPKVVRRGRPPTKNLKKALGRPSLDRAGSEFSADATLATGGESIVQSNNDLRKGTHLSDKSGIADSSGRFQSSCSDAYFLPNNKFERNDEVTGSIFNINSIKHGKKQFAFDENRRNSYRQFHPFAGGREPSVLATFSAQRKQLIAVGLLSEHGYARSLTQFAANIGPVPWEIASKRIKRSLFPGVKFGPGWVGENDIPPQRPLLLSPPPGLPPLSKPLSLPENSCALATPCFVGKKEEKLPEKPEENNSSEQGPPASDRHLSNPHSSSAPMSASPSGASIFEPCSERTEVMEGLNAEAGFNVLNGTMGVIRQAPPFQIHESRVIRPCTNGLNGTYRFNLPTQIGKLIGAARPAGVDFQSSQIVDTVPRTNSNIVHPAATNKLNTGTKNSGDVLRHSVREAMEAPRSGVQSRPPWQGLSPKPKPDSGSSPQQKSDSVPPDLNVGFQSTGFTGSTCIDAAQPDLALQL